MYTYSTSIKNNYSRPVPWIKFLQEIHKNDVLLIMSETIDRVNLALKKFNGKYSSELACIIFDSEEDATAFVLKFG